MCQPHNEEKCCTANAAANAGTGGLPEEGGAPVEYLEPCIPPADGTVTLSG